MHYVFYPNVLLKVLCVLLQSLSTLWEDGKVLFLLRLSGRVKNDDDMYFVLFPPPFTHYSENKIYSYLESVKLMHYTSLLGVNKVTAHR